MFIQKRDVSLARDSEAPISPADYGFPANPTIAQRRCWLKQERFLESFRHLGSIGAASADAGIAVGTVESWDLRDMHGFKRRKKDAGTVALGVLEKEIHRRAVEGVDRKLHFRGQVFDTERQYSDNLLMFRAKRLDPAYKDNYQPPVTAPNSVTQINIHLHPDAKRPEPRE